MILTNCQAESEIFSWRRDEFDAYSNITQGLATTAYNVFRLPFYYKIMLDLLRSEIVGIYISFKDIKGILLVHRTVADEMSVTYENDLMIIFSSKVTNKI